MCKSYLSERELLFFIIYEMQLLTGHIFFNFISMADSTSISQNLSLISVNEFKKMLATISDCRAEIGLRYRLIGEMWEQNYMRILRFTDFGLLLNDSSKNRVVVIRDLSQIMQFEIDASFHHYQPYFHYNVNPALD